MEIEQYTGQDREQYTGQSTVALDREQYNGERTVAMDRETVLYIGERTIRWA
jgi:hypothetical protein